MPSKVASETSFLCYPLTNLETFLYTSDSTLDKKSTKIFPKSVHSRLRNRVPDATFEVKNHQPRFKIRALFMRDN